MFKEPITTLGHLRKGDCFMLDGTPCTVVRTYWRKHGMFRLKHYVWQKKFSGEQWHTLGDFEVYRISRGLYRLLVPDETANEKQQEQ